MSVTYQQAAPIATAGAQSFVMPDMFASPGLTMIAPQQQSVVYAAPTQTVSYAQPAQYTYAAAEPTQLTYAAPETQYTYAAPVEMTYAAPAMTYAAPAEMTYAAPQAYEYAAPAGGQPTYTISPERFQLIMQGQPLTNEEIASMTGAPQTAAPVMTGAQSFVMPDMFASPGLTMVGGAPGQFHGAQVGTQTAGAQSFVMPDMFASPGLTMVGGNPGQFNAAPVAASTVVEPTAVIAEPVPAATSSPKKKSDKKKSDKKKVSSKKKSKGCC